ncbi:MAG: hypothetical protein KDE55_05835 [Novosphingobium sp.]|nr:hypothetical protein [Novosphingobium sp.]
MLEVIEANWLAFLLALLIGLVVAWWLFGRATRAEKLRERRERRPDVLDEGAQPAQRNQALIDAPSATAAALGGSGPPIMGGIGEIAGAAAASEVADAEAAESEPPKVVQPAPLPTQEPPAPAPAEPEGEADDLRRIKGLGPKLATLLQSLGVTTYAQIAAWSEEDIDRIDAQLGAFAGRPRRDNWVEQARLLSAGDTSGYEAKFGKL